MQKSSLQRIELQPLRPSMETPRDDSETESYLSELHGNGRWTKIVEFCEKDIARFIGTFPSPELYASDIIKLFFASEAFEALGEENKYAACLKILWSLEPFANVLAGNYRKYISAGATGYLKLAEHLGNDRLNQLPVTDLFKKKSGCFIATAAYGSPLASEVIALKELRDRILMRSHIGRMVVSAYYVLSPFPAKIIEGSDVAKKATRCILRPVTNITIAAILRFHEDYKRTRSQRKEGNH
jgi:hypothetical protein